MNMIYRSSYLYRGGIRGLFILFAMLICHYNAFADEIGDLQATPHTASWAYFSIQQSNGQVWYIANLTDGTVYFLAPFTNGNAGWGIIGGSSPTSLATVNLSSHQVVIKSGITANSSSLGYYDGATKNNQYISNLQHNSQKYAQFIDGKTVNIQWYFFKVSSSGNWYIAKPPTSTTNNSIYRFGADAQKTGYAWEMVANLERSYTKENNVYKISLKDGLPNIVSAKETDTLPEIASWISKFVSNVSTTLSTTLATILSQVCTFSDVQSVTWAKGSIDALCSAGVVIGYPASTGTGREYRPANSANLGEVLKVITVVSNYSVLTSCEPYHLNASGSNAWYVCYFNAASAAGVNKNSAEYANTVARGEAMAYIVNLFYFQSMTQQNALNFLIGKDIIDWRSDGNYRLNDPINRAELAVIAVRAAAVTGKKLPYGKYGKPYVAGSYLPKPVISEVASNVSNYGQRVLERAKLQIGKTSGNGLKWVDMASDGKIYPMCQRFVWAMHDGLSAKFNTAADACNHFRNKGVLQTTGIPPAGASVCYAETPKNSAGHIAIATGTGQEIGAISATQGVMQNNSPLANLGGYYQGWISAENYSYYYYK